MHELGIVFHVIRAVEDIGRQQQLTDVASVTLELGQVSGVVPHELESCWKWAVARTELMPGHSCGSRRSTPSLTAMAAAGTMTPYPKAGCVPSAAARTPGWFREMK